MINGRGRKSNEQKREEAFADKQRELAKLAMEDLFFFNQYILKNGRVMNEELHREMCDFATSYRQFEGTKKKKLLLEPRGSLKSTCVTIAYPLQLMVRQPNIRILLDSERLQNSRSFLTAIQGHCETNERYRDLCKLVRGKYPVPELKTDERWTSAEIISPMRSDRSIKEPTISTGGVDVVKVGQHYDVVIMDDPVSDNNITTREQIEKVIQHYKLVLSLLDPEGILIIVGTRWNFGDLYGYIIENHQKYFDVLIRRAYKEDGSLLYPERLTAEFLEEQRMSQGPTIFSNQYLNEPVSREDATFKWEKYREWEGEMNAQHHLVVKELRQYEGEATFRVIEKPMTVPVNYFLTVDPAVSDKEVADPTGMVLCGVDADNRIFVVEYVNQRLQGIAFYDELFRLVEKYHPRRVGIETTAFQKSLAFNIRDEMRKRNTFFIVEELWPDQDKIRRISTLAPRYEAGQIYVRTGMDELKYQLVNFPRSAHDDLADALSYQLQVMYPKRQRETDEDAVKKTYAYLSPITRY